MKLNGAAVIAAVATVKAIKMMGVKRIGLRVSFMGWIFKRSRFLYIRRVGCYITGRGGFESSALETLGGWEKFISHRGAVRH